MSNSTKPPLATQSVEELQNLPIIANLRKLSESLSGFQQCFTDLQQHIDTIHSSIDSLLRVPHTINTTLPVPKPEPETEPEPEPSIESDPSEDEYEVEEPETEPEPEPSIESDPSEDEYEVEEDEEEEEVEKDDEKEVKGPPRTELERICETMSSGRTLKKYLMIHIIDINRLRHQLINALKLCPNPARFILESIGKYYFNGKKAFVKGPQTMHTGRKACILALECFLLMKGEVEGEGRVVDIEKSVKVQATQAAFNWKKRIFSEGGIVKAHEMDARGLLLFVGCFGISLGFGDRDFRELLQVSNVNAISDALRRSTFLVAKIPVIIEGMLKNKMVVDAVNVAYCFGIEDRFNLKRFLTSFLQESEVSLLKKVKEFDKVKGFEQGTAVCEAKKKHLADLKSVMNCLGWHRIDPSKLLPGWQIDVKIMNLEKEIADQKIALQIVEANKMKGDQKRAQKRKIDDTESSRRFSNKEVKHSHFPNQWAPQQQRVVNYADNSNNTWSEGGGTSGHVYGYSLSPSVLNGPVAGSILAGPVGGVPMGGPGAGILASNGVHAGMDVALQGGSYAHGGSRADSTTGLMGSHAGRLYGSRSEATVYDRLPSHIYANRPPPYLEGSTGVPNTRSDDAYRPAPSVESSKGLPNTISGDASRPPPYLEGSPGSANTIAGDAYMPPYLEGSTGLPNTIAAPYQFADTTPATELHRSGGLQAADAVPSAALAHPSSYLYWKR